MPAKKYPGRDKSEPVDKHLLGVQSLIANKLYDADGNLVGKLEEIVLDVRTGCVRHVIVAMGGFLGLGRQRFAIPWSALQPDAQYCRAVVDVAQMRLTACRFPTTIRGCGARLRPTSRRPRFPRSVARSARRTDGPRHATGAWRGQAIQAVGRAARQCAGANVLAGTVSASRARRIA
jgi:sporulation protein YlmC with PRC-barrel domain